MLDQTEYVYFKSVSMASKNRKNGSVDGEISASWLKMMSCFSIISMTSWLCQEQSRPMKRFRDLLKSQFKIKKLSPNTYWVSAWRLWRMGFHSLNAKKSYVPSLFTKETRSTSNAALFDLKKVSGISRSEIRVSFGLPAYWKYDAARSLVKTRYVTFRYRARRCWTLARRVVNTSKLLKTTFFF